MSRLKQKLLTMLEGAGRVAIIGIGSELRGDDAVGLLVLDHLQRNFRKVGRGDSAEPSHGPVFKLFNGGTAPENLTGEIRRFKPDCLIMIDAIELGKKPGSLALVDIKKIENTAFLTHKLPLKLMLDYLGAELILTTIFIGIQPKNLDFGKPVSRPVMRASKQVIDLIFLALKAVKKTSRIKEKKQ